MTDTLRPNEAYGSGLRDSLEVARAAWDAERARLEARAIAESIAEAQRELAARRRLERWRDDQPRPHSRFVYSHGGDVHAVALDTQVGHLHLACSSHVELARALGLG